MKNSSKNMNTLLTNGQNTIFPTFVKLGGKYYLVNELNYNEIEEKVEGQYITHISKINIRKTSVAEDGELIQYDTNYMLNIMIHEILHIIDKSCINLAFMNYEHKVEYFSDLIHSVFIDNPKIVKLFLEEYLNSDNFLDQIPTYLKFNGEFHKLTYEDKESSKTKKNIYIPLYYSTKEINKYKHLKSIILNLITFEAVNLIGECFLKHSEDEDEPVVPIISELLHSFLVDNPEVVNLYLNESKRLYDQLD